ncbi:MAG: cupin domain-containing protein [Tissierellia bacterium]|nr:cupin domain-containing protein [Tissierellia bacterium]
MYNYYNYPCPNMSPWYRQQYRMYDRQRMYRNPYYYNTPMINPDMNNYPGYPSYPNYPYNHETVNNPWALQYPGENGFVELKDYGPNPFVININDATLQNDNYRTALWTGEHMQLTLMSLGVGEDIGLEMHPDNDQFIRIEEGQGVVQMGDREGRFNFEEPVHDDIIFIIPAGKWHNLTNTGNTPLKLYSIYAPPQHPHGTVHKTKAEAEAEHCH